MNITSVVDISKKLKKVKAYETNNNGTFDIAVLSAATGKILTYLAFSFYRLPSFED